MPSAIVIHVLHPTRLLGPLGAAGSGFSVRKRFKSSGSGYSENINLPVGIGVVGLVAVMLLMMAVSRNLDTSIAIFLIEEVRLSKVKYKTTPINY